MRAMTFERLVREESFASEVCTLTVGQLGLDRPTAVVIANARGNRDTTAALLHEAHAHAIDHGRATILHNLAVPFVGFENQNASDVKPDFAVVARQLPTEGGGTWLIMGDAKDYERVRSRIDDGRLLKGFLQVALGAESAIHWSKLPVGMKLHAYGVLAVPRNAFLQPAPVVELLNDHREEVRLRVEERRREAERAKRGPVFATTDELVRHLHSTFDPATCTTCTLFSFCRNELRTSSKPTDLLVEIGVPVHLRAAAAPLLGAGTGAAGIPQSVAARVTATVTGVAQFTGQRRVDPVGEPGTVQVVVAKSDSAALGVHGIGVRVHSATGPQPWTLFAFDDPQGADTRRDVMRVVGQSLTAAMKDRRLAKSEAPSPVHLVVPDSATANLLVSIADNLAGIELSRLRWQQDLRAGRAPLTFNGEPAQIPSKLSETQRTAVSFLLEDDRARAFTLRSPIVDARAALARCVVPGGPEASALRLDYLVRWATATQDDSADHRVVTDDIERSEHTPGARLTNRRSDAIHRALVGDRAGGPRPADPQAYKTLVVAELTYKAEVLDRAVTALSASTGSILREVHRAVEGDAQEVWRRRLALHASDLVRFGRTTRFWRNSLVPAIQSDDTCARQLAALGNPQVAHDAAVDAGTRHVLRASVQSISPLTLRVDSRRLKDGDRLVLLHVNGRPCVEDSHVTVAHQKGSFKIDGLSIGPLTATDGPFVFRWSPHFIPALAVGDELVMANFAWFSNLKGNRYLPVGRPSPDSQHAPATACSATTYETDPDAHQYCCRSHEVAEASTSDWLAERRAAGKLNPQAWPPIVDKDGFEVAASGKPAGDPTDSPPEPVPDDVTIDDLD